MWEAITMNWLLFREPIIAATIAGAVLGWLGVFVVSRRIVFVSAALSQVSALGVVLGFLASAALAASGFLAEALPIGLALGLAVAMILGLTWVGERPSMGRDALLGIAFIVPTALVLVLGPKIPSEMHAVDQLLHGSAVLVRPADLWALAIAAAAIMLAQLAAFDAFIFASLDPTVARTQGVPVRRLDLLLFASIAIMTGLVTRALGAMPTFALTVLPAIGVLGLRIGLRRVFPLAAILGATSGAAGFLVAYLMDWSVGASQTLVALALLLLTRAAGHALARPR